MEPLARQADRNANALNQLCGVQVDILVSLEEAAQRHGAFSTIAGHDQLRASSEQHDAEITNRGGIHDIPRHRCPLSNQLRGDQLTVISEAGKGIPDEAGLLHLLRRHGTSDDQSVAITSDDPQVLLTQQRTHIAIGQLIAFLNIQVRTAGHQRDLPSSIARR